jgi:hypothetical protein
MPIAIQPPRTTIFLQIVLVFTINDTSKTLRLHPYTQFTRALGLPLLQPHHLLILPILLACTGRLLIQIYINPAYFCPTIQVFDTLASTVRDGGPRCGKHQLEESRLLYQKQYHAAHLHVAALLCDDRKIRCRMTKVIHASGEWYCQGHLRLVASCSKCLRRGGSLLNVSIERTDDYRVESQRHQNQSHLESSRRDKLQR